MSTTREGIMCGTKLFNALEVYYNQHSYENNDRFNGYHNLRKVMNHVCKHYDKQIRGGVFDYLVLDSRNDVVLISKEVRASILKGGQVIHNGTYHKGRTRHKHFAPFVFLFELHCNQIPDIEVLRKKDEFCPILLDLKAYIGVSRDEWWKYPRFKEISLGLVAEPTTKPEPPKPKPVPPATSLWDDFEEEDLLEAEDYEDEAWL